jgi:hypothetical protein
VAAIVVVVVVVGVERWWLRRGFLEAGGAAAAPNTDNDACDVAARSAWAVKLSWQPPLVVWFAVVEGRFVPPPPFPCWVVVALFKWLLWCWWCFESPAEVVPVASFADGGDDEVLAQQPLTTLKAPDLRAGIGEADAATLSQVRASIANGLRACGKCDVGGGTAADELASPTTGEVEAEEGGGEDAVGVEIVVVLPSSTTIDGGGKCFATLFTFAFNFNFTSSPSSTFITGLPFGDGEGVVAAVELGEDAEEQDRCGGFAAGELLVLLAAVVLSSSRVSSKRASGQKLIIISIERLKLNKI